MVSEMNDYSFVLSETTLLMQQDQTKVGFIYKNKTVEPVSTKVLLKQFTLIIMVTHPY
jgi:predicted extracellular nuclease